MIRRYTAFVIAGCVSGILIWGILKYWNHQIACRIIFDGGYLYVPASHPPAKFRVYLIPGMGAGIGDHPEQLLNFPVIRNLPSGLVNLGADIVIPHMPYPKWCRFRNNGQAYRDAFLKHFDVVKRAAEKVHGKPPKSIVSGISFGGLHAIVVYVSRPSDFIGWQASMPVTRLAAMEEFQRLGEVRKFDAFIEAPKLKGSFGFIAWGDQDMRVGGSLGRQLYYQIRSSHIVGKQYHAAHMTGPEQIKDLVDDAQRQVLSH